METAVQLLVALSIASERLVEIIKGFVPYLNDTKPDAKEEGKRKAILQLLAIVSGIVTAFLAQSAIGDSFPAALSGPIGVFAIGLLVSGGSGFWNAILSYLLQVKNLKKLEVTKG